MSKRWGNALGGYRTQSRDGKGRFSGPSKGTIAKIAITGAAIGIGGYAAYEYSRESSLKQQHGVDYIPKIGKYSHYTNNNSARRIAATRSWNPTGKNGGHGSSEGVWLTRHSKLGHYDGLTRDVFGKARVDVVLSRKTVLGSMEHSIPGGLDRSNKNITHVQVNKKALQGKRVSHNLPKTPGGTRSRAQAHFASGKSGYRVAVNMAVNPVRAKAKKRMSK